MKFWCDKSRVQRVVDGSFGQNALEEPAFWLGFQVLGKLVKELVNHKKQKRETYFEEQKEKMEYPTRYAYSQPRRSQPHPAKPNISSK